MKRLKTYLYEKEHGVKVSLLEDNLGVLEDIVNTNKAKNIQFSDATEMVVDTHIANAILSVYSRANSGNKKKISDMLHKSINSYQTLAQFSLGNS